PRPMRVWVQGARPRTLVAAVCPVLVGTAAAASEGAVVAWRALAALVVALALQVGVNYANDYSDGLRGTDTPGRLGPARLAGHRLGGPARRPRAPSRGGGGGGAGPGRGRRSPAPAGRRGRDRGRGAVHRRAPAVRLQRVRGAGRAGLLRGGGDLRVGVRAAGAGPGGGRGRLGGGRPGGGGDPAGQQRPRHRRGPPGRQADPGRPPRPGPGPDPVRGRAMVGAAGLLGLGRPTVLVTLAALPLAVAPVRLVRTRDDGPGLIAALGATARLQLAVSLLLAAGLWLSWAAAR